MLHYIELHDFIYIDGYSSTMNYNSYESHYIDS